MRLLPIKVCNTDCSSVVSLKTEMLTCRLKESKAKGLKELKKENRLKLKGSTVKVGGLKLTFLLFFILLLPWWTPARKCRSEY